MNLCGLQTLRKRQRWQDRRQSFRHHALARSRRSYHDKIVTTGGSYFQSPFHALLATHVSIVEVEVVLLFIEDLTCVHHRRLELLDTSEKCHDIGHGFQTIDVEFVDDSSFMHVLLRDDQPFVVFSPCLDSDGQDALHRLQLTIKAELTNHHIPVELGCVHLPRCRKNGDSQRQVEAAALLAQVGRSEVHGQIGTWKLIAIVLHGGRNAVTSLTHCFIAKPREMVHHATRQTNLNGHRCHFQAIDSSTICLYQHRSASSLIPRFRKIVMNFIL